MKLLIEGVIKDKPYLLFRRDHASRSYRVVEGGRALKHIHTQLELPIQATLHLDLYMFT